MGKIALFRIFFYIRGSSLKVLQNKTPTVSVFLCVPLNATHSGQSHHETYAVKCSVDVWE